MLTITLLGTAATMPLPDRALTAAVAECGGHSLLFDCGEGTQTAARRAGVNLMKLDAICLTHYHGDHIFGLPGLLQTLGCQGRTRPLTIFGPAEGMEPVWGAIRTLTGPQPYAIRAVPLGTDPVRLETLAPGWPVGAELLPFRTKHRVPSRGYRLDLPRAGRFDPARARVLGVPVQQWRSLQRGEPVTLEDGTAIAPGQVLGAPRRGCGSCSPAIRPPAPRWNRLRGMPTCFSAMPPTRTMRSRPRRNSMGTAPSGRTLNWQRGPGHGGSGSCTIRPSSPTRKQPARRRKRPSRRWNAAWTDNRSFCDTMRNLYDS